MTKLILGLTGQVGSGKTFAADELQKKVSFEYIDLDKIGHELLSDKTVQKQLCKSFGYKILKDNSICRKTLGEIVFSDSEKLNQLNIIMHPEIKAKTVRLISKTQQRLVIIVGALLDEINLISICNKIINISVEEKDQLKNIGIKKRVIKHQKSKMFYKKMADITIKNTYDKEFIDKFINLVQNLKRRN